MKKIKMKSKAEIQQYLNELKSPSYRRSNSCNMGYELAGTIDALEWVLGLREHKPLAGRRA